MAVLEDIVTLLLGWLSVASTAIRPFTLIIHNPSTLNAYVTSRKWLIVVVGSAVDHMITTYIVIHVG